MALPAKHGRHWFGCSAPFTAEAIARVPPRTVGVYCLRTARGRSNFIRATRDLRRALRRHLTRGDIPAASFRAFAIPSYASAVRLARGMVADVKPYYNVAG